MAGGKTSGKNNNNFSINPVVLYRDLKDVCAMFFASARRKYPFPKRSAAWAILFLLYFIIPFDLMPEALFLFLGFSDDLLLLVYVLNKMRPDIDNYREFVKQGKIKNEKVF
ncbi:MAG: DUF1232 domain-containing protein [Endomicrobium sp.]|jgi:uncharacterized membrane protein YkvA (DUF1232 family)|nr:DUF1232 domain-containing protein [Endomicrobium sp.]